MSFWRLHCHVLLTTVKVGTRSVLQHGRERTRKYTSVVDGRDRNSKAERYRLSRCQLPVDAPEGGRDPVPSSSQGNGTRTATSASSDFMASFIMADIMSPSLERPPLVHSQAGESSHALRPATFGSPRGCGDRFRLCRRSNHACGLVLPAIPRKTTSDLCSIRRRRRESHVKSSS